jgi:hypothetical protein
LLSGYSFHGRYYYVNLVALYAKFRKNPRNIHITGFASILRFPRSGTRTSVYPAALSKQGYLLSFLSFFGSVASCSPQKQKSWLRGLLYQAILMMQAAKH